MVVWCLYLVPGNAGLDACVKCRGLFLLLQTIYFLVENEALQKEVKQRETKRTQGMDDGCCYWHTYRSVFFVADTVLCASVMQHLPWHRGSNSMEVIKHTKIHFLLFPRLSPCF